MDIFVFGSNLAGRHGKGAALHAAKFYGAKRGEGRGMTGAAYAIPTKDEKLRPLPLSDVARGVVEFVEYAGGNADKTFHLTPVGCGLAGNSKREIWRILECAGLPENVVLTSSWVTG